MRGLLYRMEETSNALRAMEHTREEYERGQKQLEAERASFLEKMEMLQSELEECQQGLKQVCKKQEGGKGGGTRETRFAINVSILSLSNLGMCLVTIAYIYILFLSQKAKEDEEERRLEFGRLRQSEEKAQQEADEARAEAKISRESLKDAQV